MSSKYFPYTIFFIFIFLYAIGSFSRIPFGDCVGYIYTTETEKFVNAFTSTSHLLYINSTIIIKKMLGFDAVLSHRFLIIVSAAFTVFILYKITQLFSVKPWVSITTSIVFGLSFTFWRNAEIVEVYTFNTFLIALFLYSMVLSFQQKNSSYYISLSGFFLGLSLWSHIQNIFFIPSFLLFLYYFRTQRKSIFISLFLFILLFSLMFVVNQIRGLALLSPFTSDQGVSWVQDSLEKDLKTYTKDVGVSILYLLYNFNIFTFFGIIGVGELFRYNKKIFYLLFIAGTLNFGFATFYAVSDNYVFFIPAYLIFAIGIGLGLKRFKNSVSIRRLVILSLFIPLFYCLTFYFVSNIPQSVSFQEKKSYKGGLNYYLLPWMSNNVGILEFTIEKRHAPEPINWMTASAIEFIELKKSQGYTLEEIKKL